MLGIKYICPFGQNVDDCQEKGKYNYCKDSCILYSCILKRDHTINKILRYHRINKARKIVRYYKRIQHVTL